MTGLGMLWLPILLSAIAVFLASAVIHMAPLWYKDEYPQAPDEEALRRALGPLALPPGEYMVPRCHSGAQAGSSEFQDKLRQDPVAILTVIPNGPMSLGRNLSTWFVYTVVVAVFAAYVAGRALAPGADYLRVFQLAGVTAFLGHALALWQMSIWYQRSWRLSLKATLDGLIYAGLTGGLFGWLWPH